MNNLRRRDMVHRAAEAPKLLQLCEKSTDNVVNGLEAGFPFLTHLQQDKCQS